MHLQARDLKDIKRGNQVKSSKRQDLEETGFNEGTDENATGLGQVGHKRPRIDYSVFRTDVARLQPDLDASIGTLGATNTRGIITRAYTCADSEGARNLYHSTT